MGAAGTSADQDTDGAFRTFPSSIEWSVELPAPAIAPPVVVNDVVVVALLPDTILATRATNGKKVWTVKLSATAPIAAGDDIVLVAAEDAVHALAAGDGKTRWKREVKGVTTPPVVRGGWAIVASGDELTAIRASDGTLVWSRKVGPVSQRSTIDGDVLYVALGDGRLVALDLTTGASRWESSLGTIQTPPLVYGDRLYVGVGKQLVCLKTDNGAVDWPFTVGAPLVGAIAADDDHIYTASMDNLLRAFRRTTGSREWQQDLKYRPIGGPIVTGSSVSAPGRSASIPSHDASTGKPSAQLVLPSQAVTAPILIPPDGGRPGRLAIIANEVGKPWVLVVAAEPPPAPPVLPVGPISVLPGTSLPIPTLPQ